MLPGRLEKPARQVQQQGLLVVRIPDLGSPMAIVTEQTGATGEMRLNFGSRQREARLTLGSSLTLVTRHAGMGRQLSGPTLDDEVADASIAASGDAGRVTRATAARANAHCALWFFAALNMNWPVLSFLPVGQSE